jgi:hypothetical protein
MPARSWKMIDLAGMTNRVSCGGKIEVVRSNDEPPLTALGVSTSSAMLLALSPSYTSSTSCATNTRPNAS